MSTPLTKKIESTITPTALSMGYEIVRVLMVGVGSTTPTLQIMAEKPDGTMDVDDCERLSQAVSAILDVEGTIDEAYHLEISSPGIDRPLTRLKDFDTYKNNDVRIELSDALDGQKKFKGMLLGVEGDKIKLSTEAGDVLIPFTSLEKAKLVLTDELIRAVTAKENRAKKDARKQKRLEKTEARNKKKPNNTTKTGT